jgi:hypothetical protein
LDHCEEVFGDFVVSGGDAAAVFEFAEEAFDPVALSVERVAEAGLPFAI